MPKKKYAQQHGPNLVFYDIGSEPDCAITHKHGCGGMIAQDLGGGDLGTRSMLPENTPGKLFCYECGHKVSKAVTAAIKTGQDRSHFYFPGKAEYELRPKIHIEGNPQHIFRYWSWEGGLSQPEQPFARLRMPKKKRLLGYGGLPMKKKLPKTVITQEDDDWIITHPRITMRLPMAQFDSGDAAKIERAWRSSANIDKTTEELEEIAREALDVGFVAIMNHPEFFGVVEGDTVVIMRRPAWDSELVGTFANQIKGLPPKQIENCASIFALAHGKTPESITVETDFLDKLENEEELERCAEEPDVPEKKGPFGGQSDMRIRQSKITISYLRGNGTCWFLTLNREIWDDDIAHEVRKMIRSSVYQTPEEFVSKMTSTAQMLGRPADLNSFQVSLNIHSAEAILFNPIEKDINF